MIQYNLRLDERLKERAKSVAKKRGLSENALYQNAIAEYLARSEGEEFFAKLVNRIVTPQEKAAILTKLKKNRAPVLFDGDKNGEGNGVSTAD